MSHDVLVKVEGVSKKFCRSLKRSLWYGVQDVSAEMFGRKGSYGEPRKNEFWAVNDVSFELKRGECLGLIGPNGAGKSTLLKMMNGLAKPDKGRITMRGRVGALIELGAGFNPILTARENIFVNGSVLGFSKREIERKFDAIVDFAEIEEFIDTPVQNFSSGMKVRLGFAVAAQMEPDVLLIDEVLAVGDIGFRAKCFNAIGKLSSRAAVVLVSHQMPAVSRTCNRALLMSGGRCELSSSDVGAVVQKYFGYFSGDANLVVNGQRARFHKIRVMNSQGIPSTQISYLDDLLIEFEFEVDPRYSTPELGITISDENLQNIVQCNTHYDGIDIKNDGKIIRASVTIPKITLNPGVYSLSAGINDDGLSEVLVRWIDFQRIQIIGDFVGYAPVVSNGLWRVQGMNSGDVDCQQVYDR